MALNFPNPATQTPVDTFSPTSTPSATTNGVTYVWDGVKWTAKGTLPGYVRIDGDTMTGALNVPAGATGTEVPQVQEVVQKTGDTMTGNLTVPSLNDGQIAFRNQIINGDFRIWQRGETYTSTTSSNAYRADHWFTTITAAGATVNKGTAAPKGFSTTIEINSVVSNIQQGIELAVPGQSGVWAAGSTWTLSVWCNQDISAFAPFFRFRDVVGDGTNQVDAATPPAFTSTGETDGSWTRYSTTFTLNSNAPNPTNTSVSFHLEGGSDARAYTGAQLEPGPVATPFEHRPIGTELALCQRYYQKYDSIRLYPIANSGSSDMAYWGPRTVTMRVNPTTETATIPGTGGTTYGTAECIKIITNQPSGSATVSDYTAEAEL